MASATAIEKILPFRMTYKNGISAWIAPAPSPYTLPKMQTALMPTSAAEMSDGRTGCSKSLPSSINTGAAKSAFMPAYKMPPK